MKKKMLAMLTSLALLLYSTPVMAADLPITISNSWTVQHTGGGSYSYTIPYTGYYDITLSAEDGGTYGSSSGCGYTLSKRIWLTKGTSIGCNLVESNPSYSGGTTMTVAAGKESTLSINGSTVWRAKGGISTTGSGPAPSGTTSVVTKNCDGSSVSHSVHWHNGNTNANATFPAITGTTSRPSGSCYHGGHVHGWTTGCPYRKTGEDCHCTFKADENGNRSPSNGCEKHDHTNKYSGVACDGANMWVVYTETFAPKTPSNKYWNNGGSVTIQGCSYTHGEILNPGSSPSAGSCYYASGWTPDSANVDSRQASFRISLTESQQLQMYNTTVRTPSYRNGSCHLILKDDTVTYFKR